MKKIYSYVAILAISSIAFLSSCSKNDDEPMPNTVTPEVTVTLNENTNTTGTETLYVKRDKTSAVVQVNGISKTTTDMKRIYVYKKSTIVTAGGTINTGTYVNYNGSGFKKDGADNYYYDIPADQKNNVSLTLTLELNANNTSAVSDEYYFAFTDGSNFGGPTNATGTLLGPSKIVIVYGALTETTGHKLNNIFGPNLGAFDLVTLTNKSASDPATGKDMNDYDPTNPTAPTAVWSKAFNSGNSGTLFVKLPANFDYSSATDLIIKTAYESANTEIETQTGIFAGDMYVAKLRGLDTYALIKVTFISEESGSIGSGNNNEYMEFSVKK